MLQRLQLPIVETREHFVDFDEAFVRVIERHRSGADIELGNDGSGPDARAGRDSDVSLRGRRIARRERREIARRAKLDKLREGRNLRVRPAWATVIQAFAFVRKELAEIIRQPRLLLLLVVGPFLLLVLFGAGYQDANVVLRTQFVGPEGSVYEQAITEYADQLEQYIDSMGFTSDVDAAVRRLEDEELDAVVVFPPDALDQILAGESARIEVLHEKLDPFQQAAIEIASRLAVQEVNASVLGAIAAEAQDALAPVDQAAGELAEQASALSAAVAAGDTAAMAATAGSAGATLRDIQTVIAGSQDVVRRLGGEPDDVGADALAQIDSAAAEAESISEGGGADIATQAGDAGGDVGGRRGDDPRRVHARPGGAGQAVRGTDLQHRSGGDRARRFLRPIGHRLAAATPRPDVRRLVAGP